ncbi:MAG: response regulator [Hellea sp.]
MAIETTVELIKQKQKANQSIDGLSLLNNLIFSLSTWREYEISTHLARDALELEKKFDANLPGLTEFRIGRLLNNQGKFLEALPFIESGLSFAENPVVRKNLSIAHVITLAGLGETELAQAEFTALERAFLSTNGNKNDINFNSARAAIAISKGDRDEALRLTASVNDATVQKLLTKYNSNTSDLLANLENAKDRQAEREAALEREASLQKSRAEQKARTNQLLLILSGFLALSALLAVIFARYRDKISKELAIKTLEAEDADRMKSEFLGMISHELRTPLNGIVGIADLLAMQAPSPDLRHKAGIILDSSNKLTHVIESIVDMSRIDGEKMELYPEPTNIHAIVSELEQLWRPAIEDKGVTFTSFVEDSLSEDIIIDKQRLRQCLNSLISNAAKFTDSGRVHLHVTAKLFEAKGETEVTAIIADTGQGMSQTVQEKLFTPFLQADSTMTRKHGGSGLGLAITQSLARMMGGDVTMVSNQGRGSEFTMTVRGEKSDAAIRMDEVEDLLSEVPLAEIEFEKSQDSLRVNAQADLGASSQNASSQDVSHQDITQDGPLILDKTDYAPIDLASHDLEPDAATPINTVKTMDIEINAPIKRAQPTIRRDTDNLRGLKVLIVEDIAANQDIIKLFLGPEGCESLCASDGQEALDVLNTQVVDVILMDIRMPTMDGIEATRAIRGSNREYKNTPIIALTADVSAETNAACMAAGADIFLTKPIMARQLIESIRFVRRFQDTGEDTDKDTGEDATVNAA